MSAAPGGAHALLARSPGLAQRFDGMAAYFRDGAELPAALRELAILATARAWNCAYVWGRHLDRATALPITPGLVDAIATGASPPHATEAERVVLAVCGELRGAASVQRASWEQARRTLGDAGAVDLIALSLFYRSVIALAETPG